MSAGGSSGRPRSQFEKIWERHVVTADRDSNKLLVIDRHPSHEGSFHAFDKLADRALPVARPELTPLVADHYSRTRNRHLPIADPEVSRGSSRLAENARRFGLELIGLDDPRQGIVHVIGPQLGFTLPGLAIVRGDSHTSTHGPLGRSPSASTPPRRGPGSAGGWPTTTPRGPIRPSADEHPSKPISATRGSDGRRNANRIKRSRAAKLPGKRG